MNQSRLEQLFEFLKEDPDDPFNWYALATEYLKKDPKEALKYYEKLLTDYENYVPTYYHAAKVYAALGEHEQAEHTFRKGIQVSLQQGNRKAQQELQNAYNEWKDEME
ncbi:tetratricopeptide repeat protein [Rhodocytophaga rosea]|uniref:Tetratricopeptide repeat protein n=1 Tax=Rhodocytophaga rosea TaxID=2704465 RepID=A0A6C0GCB2_9BACT|nr:tetratricopeptide repeat protein [Rhodocytophaga rosea]QHT65629.1 tetratricopeptide repeat protein [Rhodocytophaga rosea]